jgi:hypothetical protein
MRTVIPSGSMCQGTPDRRIAARSAVCTANLTVACPARSGVIA